MYKDFCGNCLVSDKNKTKISIINGNLSATDEMIYCTQLPGILPWCIQGNEKVKD
jgi:hypothetical protein